MKCETFGTVTKVFLKGWQNWNKSPEEQIKETPFSEEKTYCFSKILSELFSTSAETFARIVKTTSILALENFEGKPCLKLLTRFQTYLHFEPKT